MSLTTSGPATITVVEVVSQAYCTSISFNGCIIRLMGLIDWDGGERPVCLLDHEIPSLEFLSYFRVCRRQFHHVLQARSAHSWCDPWHGTTLPVL